MKGLDSIKKAANTVINSSVLEKFEEMTIEKGLSSVIKTNISKMKRIFVDTVRKYRKS